MLRKIFTLMIEVEFLVNVALTLFRPHTESPIIMMRRYAITDRLPRAFAGSLCSYCSDSAHPVSVV